MTEQTVTLTKNADLRIPWKTLQSARFPLGKFRVAIKQTQILIVPLTREIAADDWMTAPEVVSVLEQRAGTAEKEIMTGKVRPIADLFAKLGV